MDGISNNLDVQTVIDEKKSGIGSNKASETVQVRTAQGTIVNVPLDALILLLRIEKTAYLETEGKKIADDIDGVCKKIKMLDNLYKDVFELSEKDGSIDWEKKGLGSSIEALRKEGFVIPAKKGVLHREERDALLRSVTQQRDDLSSQTSQLNMKLNRCYSLRDDLYRYISGIFSSYNDSCKKIFRNVG